MEEVQGSALEAGAEVIVETPKGEEGGGQVQENQVPEGVNPEEQQKTERQLKREKEKARLARLRSEVEEAKSREAEAERRKQAILEAGKKEAPPKEADFPDPIEFAAAKAIWGAEQRLTEREARNAGEAAEAARREAEEIQKREQAVVAESWTAQVAEAKTRYADFDQVALANDLPVTKAMGELIMTSDVGSDVLYHLGQNRALATQIAAMNPVEAARAIGRIEASLSVPKPRTETKAPDPISPVRGSAGVARDPAKMSVEEYKAWRAAGGKVD